MDSRSTAARARATLVLAGIAGVMMGSIPAMAAGSLRPERLRCEYLVDPLAVEVKKPRLSWIVSAARDGARGLRQTAYRVIVASADSTLEAGRGDLWDTGRISSKATTAIVYEGRSLVSAMRDRDEADTDRPRVRDALYLAYERLHRGIRTRSHKLIEYNVEGVRHTQLFDLQEDPYELDNLADDPAQADLLRELRTRLAGLHDAWEDGRSEWGKSFWSGVEI